MSITRAAGLRRTLGEFAVVPLLVVSMALVGCATRPAKQMKIIAEEGLNIVRVESNPDTKEVASQPILLTPTQVASILRGVRAWERRNAIHRLVSGEAPRTRAFRDDEISFLAPAISRALAVAGPFDRVYFHLSRATETGEEETTTGWLHVRDPLLSLVLSEVHDRHPPGPDISRYDRRMPDIPEQSGSFDVTFEPEQYLEKVVSKGGIFSADQREELRIRYRDVLPMLPAHPLVEPGKESNLSP